MNNDKKEDDQTNTLVAYLKPLALIALILAAIMLAYTLGGWFSVSGKASPAMAPTKRGGMKGGCGCMSGAYN